MRHSEDMTESTVCPHCGSGDVEQLLDPRLAGDLFATIPSANRRCLVCGVRWELDDLDIDFRTA